MTTILSEGSDEFQAGYDAALAGEQMQDEWSDEKKLGWKAQRADHWGDDNFG